VSCDLTIPNAPDSFRKQKEKLTAFCSGYYSVDCLALYKPCN